MLPHLEGETSCHLLLRDLESGAMYDVASAIAYPSCENEVCHTMLKLPRHLKVKVHKVSDEFLSLPLLVPVPAFEFEALENAIGTYVQWPITLIVRFFHELALSFQEIHQIPTKFSKFTKYP